MKKLSLLIVMLVAMAIGVKAQGHYIIPTLGFNVSSMSVDQAYYQIEGYKFDMNTYITPRFGFSAGVSYRYEFNKPFLIEVGLGYNNYGYNMKDVKINNMNIIANYNFRMSHFSVPVMFGYKFVIGKNRIFSITPKVGLQFGAYMNVTEKCRLLDLKDVEQKCSYKEYFDNSAFDVAEIIAVEFGWKVSNMLDIFVNVNNRYSFKNNLAYRENNNAKMYNYTFGVMAGVRAKVGK